MSSVPGEVDTQGQSIELGELQRDIATNPGLVPHVASTSATAASRVVNWGINEIKDMNAAEVAWYIIYLSNVML